MFDTFIRRNFNSLKYDNMKVRIKLDRKERSCINIWIVWKRVIDVSAFFMLDFSRQVCHLSSSQTKLSSARAED